MPIKTMRLMFEMHLHMLLQLIASMEILFTAREVTGVFAHFAVCSPVFCKVGRLGEFLVAYITLQWFVFGVRSFVYS